MKLLRLTSILTIFAGIIVYALWLYLNMQPVVKLVPQVKILSPRELQEFLNEQGHPRYKCKIDGIIGKETIRAWENYCCDQYAIREIEK